MHVPKNESGLASRMGHLDGLDGMAPHRTSSSAVRRQPRRVRRAGRPAIPFNDGARAFAGAGLDLKYRLTSSLSLDGTINPDFGQVEVDPAVVNLTAFETFFEEKRPFFIEGREHLQQLRPRRREQLLGLQPLRAASFYSRRIGRAPQGSASGDFVEQPTATTILGAAKLTGKTRSGWSLGLLDAVTGREWATDGRPADRERRDRGRAALQLPRRPRASASLDAARRIGAIATAVNRDLGAPALRRRSAGAGLRRRRRRLLFLDSKRDWVINGRIARQPARRQHRARSRGCSTRRSATYSRPDATHVELDPAATSLGGWTGSVNLNRNAGVHQRQRGAVGSQPGLRFERRRLHLHRAIAPACTPSISGAIPKVTRFARRRFLAVAKWYTWNFARRPAGRRRPSCSAT